MKRFNLKRALALLLCLMALISVVACGAETADTTAGTDTGAFTDDAMTNETEEAVTDFISDVIADTAGETQIPEDTETNGETTTEKPSDEQTDAKTDAVTTINPENLPKSKEPVIVGVTYTAKDRAVIYGVCETNAVITSWGKDGMRYDDASDGVNFRIEVKAGETAHITATAPGKRASDEITKHIPEGKDMDMSVFGGRDSRLYYQGTLQYICGNYNASELVLSITKSKIQKALEEVRKFTGKNTKFVFVVAPNPASVYYDRQKDYINIATNGKQMSTPAMQFVNYMKDIDGVIIPDLYKLYNEKKDENLYFYTDTHYNELGAFYAYRAVMDEIEKDFPKASSYKLSDFSTRRLNVPAGDLANMLGVNNMTELVTFYEPKFSDTGAYFSARRAAGYTIGCNPALYPTASTTSNSYNPKVHLVGDSYSMFLLPYLGASSKMLTTNTGVISNFAIDYAACQRNQVDYVFFVFTDRNLDPSYTLINSCMQLPRG